jgi:adenosylcobinamide-GDP ribazoletransferase
VSIGERPGGEIAAAFALLTRIPVRSSSRDATGAAAYGLVGAVVGALGGLVMVALGEAVPTLAAVLAVTAMAAASGAIHLDGLADTTDALLARDAAQAEIARKDPAIGSGGVVALILVLAAEVTALANLAVLPGGSGPLVAGLACIAAGAGSRALPVVVVLLRGDAVGRVGLGAWFAERVGVVDGISAAVTAALVAVATGLLAGAIAFGAGIAVGAACALGAGLILVRARRQVDGDILGATVELGFAAIVAAVAIAMSVTWPAR